MTNHITQSELEVIENEIESNCADGRGSLTHHGAWLFGILTDVVHGNIPTLDPIASGGLDLCGLEKFVKWEEIEWLAPIDDDPKSFGPEHVGPHGPHLSTAQIIVRAIER